MNPSDLWIREGSRLLPTVEYFCRLSEYLRLNARDDPVFRFVFATKHDGSDLLINKSRLEWAGGPLKALTAEYFKEGQANMVTLSEDDHPVAYSVLCDFLYAKVIDLSTISTLELAMCTMRSAHRWNLQPLVRHIGEYVRDQDMVSNVSQFVQYVKDASLDRIFQNYFWEKVGKCFKKFSEHGSDEEEGDKDSSKSKLDTSGAGYTNLCFRILSEHTDADSPSIEVELCPKFPELWYCAVEQGMAQTVINAILKHSVDASRDKLLDIILQFLEPRIQDDDIILHMIQNVCNSSCKLITDVLNQNDIDIKCSTRAMRLLAKSILVFTNPKMVKARRAQARAAAYISRYNSSD